MSVRTVNVVDPRLEPPPEPVFTINLGPGQWQTYDIPASGLSDTLVTFNNLTMLGPNRIYSDKFEIRYKLQITMNGPASADTGGAIPIPSYGSWCFDSFPLNKVTDQLRVNINGGASYSRPAYTVPFLERYWDQEKLLKCYADTCPVLKPQSMVDYGNSLDTFARSRLSSAPNSTDQVFLQNPYRYKQCIAPERFCNSIQYTTTGTANGAATIVATIREPLLVSPFNGHLLHNYGSPLYNITSLDFTFTLNDLRNMIMVHPKLKLSNYSVHILEASICYEVFSLQPGVQVPSVINRNFIQRTTFVTDYKGPTDVDTLATTPQEIISGVYTLGTIPTAIWVFVAPNLGSYGTFNSDSTDVVSHFYNKLFGCIKHISITLGNTTQILNTTSSYDRYRICKANGLQDDFYSFHNESRIANYISLAGSTVTPHYFGGLAGSVLRLVPGVDLLTPDVLIPGANANQMICQVAVSFTYDFGHLENTTFKSTPLALWLMFEYSGVITLSPGHCVIDTMPIKNVAAAQQAASTMETVIPSEVTGETAPTGDPGQISGTGWLDNLKNGLRQFWNKLKKSKVLSVAADIGTDYLPAQFKPLKAPIKNLVGQIEGDGYDLNNIMSDGGDDNMSGGAVMGLGDFC